MASVAAAAPTLLRQRPWLAALAAATGVCLGVAVGLPLARGHGGAVALVLLCDAGLLGLVRLVVPEAQRRTVGRLVLLAVSARFALASVLYFASEAAGHAALVSSVPLYYVVGDDATYAEVSWGVVQWFRGTPDLRFTPPSWNGQAYLLGTFTYLEMAVFAIFGPIVLYMQIVNGALAGAMIVLVHDLARRMSGDRPALVAAGLCAFFPSMMLWSALNLKDAMAGLLIVCALWLLVRFQMAPRWPLLLAIFLVLIPIETIRRYVYLGLTVVFPIAVALGPKAGIPRWIALLSPRFGMIPRRFALTVAAIVLGLILGSFGSDVGQGTYGVPTGFDAFESIRQGMGEGARTTFADPRAVIAQEGQAFVVVDAEQAQRDADAAASPVPTSPPSPSLATPSAPGATPVPAATQATPSGTSVPAATQLTPTGTPSPTRPSTPGGVPAASATATASPRVVVLKPGGRVVLASGTPTPQPTPSSQGGQSPVASSLAMPTPEPPSDVVIVHPGDVVIVSAVAVSSPAEASHEPLYLKPTLELANSAQLVVTQERPEVLTVTRTLEYIPRGLAYALFAPFPWDLRRPLDALTVPEMLVWYAALAAIPWALWRERRLWPSLLPLALYVGGMMAVFALTEGNFGTLYRHRAMVAPAALILASPGLLAGVERVMRAVTHGSRDRS